MHALFHPGVELAAAYHSPGHPHDCVAPVSDGTTRELSYPERGPVYRVLTASYHLCSLLGWLGQALLILPVVYVFSIFGYLFLSKYYPPENNAYCDTVLQCMLCNMQMGYATRARTRRPPHWPQVEANTLRPVRANARLTRCAVDCRCKEA